MRRYQDKLLHSASDLNAFLGCAHAAALNLQKLVEPDSLPNKAVDDDGLKLIQDAGHAHEAAYLEQLQNSDQEVVVVAEKGDLQARVDATMAAMATGAPVIYQAAFLTEPWHGFADFLQRVDRPSRHWPWSYEPVDTKLARTADPKHVVQLGLYVDLLEAAQGVRPHEMHLVLGDGRQESFRQVEFVHTINAAKARYLQFLEGGAKGSKAEPCSACTFCGWRDYCGETWQREDHLSLVAGINRGQIDKLRRAGIGTVMQLATADPFERIPRLSPETFGRLCAQAKLQVARRSGEPVIELLPTEPNRGFARLPEPDPADLFFDLEGDPLYPGGLEYLWGVHFRDGTEPKFIAEWAHDREAERAAFEKIVDFFIAHLDAHPGAHIYHYAPYEVTVLRRLSTAFASREDEVDALLRGEKLIDLYTVTKQALRTSEGSLSLKTLEIFFTTARQEDVTKADQSIVHYHRWRQTKEKALLDGILAYNRVDCENTEGLRNWLVGLRPVGLDWRQVDPVKAIEERQDDPLAAEIEALRERLIQGAPGLTATTSALMAHLLDFHRRAAKPEWWAMFDRRDRSDDELMDDGECLGALEPAGDEWVRPEKKSLVYRFRYPEQDSKLKVGDNVLVAASLARAGTIFSVDPDRHIVEIKKGPSLQPLPEQLSLIPTGPIDTTILRSAVRRVARSLAAPNAPYRAIVDLLERRAPRLMGHEGPLVEDAENLIDAAVLRALAMDHTSLFIQGPPGCGKTHTSAHVILALLQAGKRVGVSSNSHKAINNLLLKIEQVALDEGITFSGAKKASRTDESSRVNSDMFVDELSNEDILFGGYDLVGGTAWLFADEAFDQYFDYIFVDEAGQVSLGHLVAMGASARNIILVGDQMQLGQPIQGAHPGESGLSVLEYLLQGQATIAPDRGILLDTSWRMHPDVCSFISEAVYDGRLRAHPDNTKQRLVLGSDRHPALRETGISLVDMDHRGCSQRSEEEAELVSELVRSLLNQRFVDRHGVERAMTLENILVVAPYNMQVNLLRARLPEGARVGTVDKFQGQEAEVVIVSMTTSSPDDLPRHVDFFYSKNRLNVAISRARTLSLVLANPRLLELDATKVEDLRLVNTLAWLRAESSGIAPQTSQRLETTPA